jgi:hypothetical protein
VDALDFLDLLDNWLTGYDTEDFVRLLADWPGTRDVGTSTFGTGQILPDQSMLTSQQQLPVRSFSYRESPTISIVPTLDRPSVTFSPLRLPALDPFDPETLSLSSF